MDFNEGFETFWATYPLNSFKKGAKSKAKKAYDKKVKTQEQAYMVIEALRAQMRYRKESIAKGTWMPDFCMPSTWMNQDRFDIEIPSHSEIKAKTATNCKCGAKADFGPRFGNLCYDCYEKQRKAGSRNQGILT